MAQKNIDFGTFPDDPNADAIRTAFQKVQENFTDLYSGLQDQAVLSVNRTAGAGITVNSPTGNVIVTANISYLRVTTSTLAIGRDGNGSPGISRDANITQSSQTLYVDLPANIEGVTSAAFSGNVVANNFIANTNVNTTNLTVTSNASAGNISTTGSLSVTGNANAGNINTVTGVFSNGVQATVAVIAGNLHANAGAITAATGTITGNLNVGNLQGILANGTSNVRIPATNGNVNISAAGNANIVVVTGTGANITGTANVTGNLSASNVDGGNTVTANYFVGDGSLLTNVVALANSQIVSGTSKAEIVSSGGNLAVTIGGTSNVLVVSSTGANVTGTLNATGNANVGNLGTAGAITATGNITGAMVAATTNGTGNNFKVGDDAWIGDINITNTIVIKGQQDAANGYIIFGNGDTTSTLGRSGTGPLTYNGAFTAVGNANVGNLTTSQVSATGNVTSPQFISNVATGTSPLIVSSTTKVANLNADLLDGYSTDTAATANTVVIRDVNGSFSANIVTANLSGNATTAGTVVTAAQPNITSVGTLTSLAVTGNVTAGNVYANSGTIGASLLTGTLTTAGQPNITSVGTLTSLSVTGNISGANLTGNHFGNGSALSAITGANVTGTVANATYAVSAGSAGSATTAGTVTTNAQPNITSVGTLASLGVTGNITTTTGVFIGNGLGLTNLAGANVTGTVANATYATSAGSATTAGTVTTNAQPNITSVGTLSSLSVTGNANVGNIGATNGVFTNVSGNGSALTAITGGNVTGTVANATYATSAGSATTATSATTAGTVTTAAQPNITSVGTLTSVAVTGNATAGNVYANSGTISANVINGNLVGGTLTTAAQPNITSVGTLTSLSVTGNANVGNIGATSGVFTGNISAGNANLGNLARANFFQGDGSLLTNISVSAGSFIVNGNSNVTVDANNSVRISSGGTANVLVVNSSGANITGTANISGNLSAGNVSATTLSGNVISPVQTSITSLGTLTGLTVNGVSNLGPNSNVIITGGVANAFLMTNGSGNLTWNTGTLVPAQGANTQVIFNDGGSNYAGNANLTFNKTTGNLSVGGGLTVTGNLAAANITGVNNFTATSITGTLTAGPQTGINAIGTLTALTVTGTTAANNFNATNYANAKYIWANSGSITSNIHSLTVLQTWNNSSVQFSAMEANIIDTASAANSLLLDLQISSSSKFAVSKEGNVFFTGTINGNGSGLSAIAAANIVGSVPSATTAGTVTTAAQPNITSVGTLTSLGVNGTITGTRLISNVATGTAPLTVTSTTQVANLNAATAGTVITAAQPNITSVGTLTSLSVTGTATAGNLSTGGDLSVSGNAVITGNLAVNGNLTYLNTETVAVEDPIIQLQTGANGAAPVANSGKDVGSALNYYDTQARVAFMGWDVSNVEFGLASQASITNEVVTFTTYGNLRVGNIIGNGQALTGIAGANVTGTVASATSATNASAVLNNVRTTGTYYPAFISATANGNYALNSNAAFSATLSNGQFIATTFTGNLFISTTNYAIATTPSEIDLGYYGNTALSSQKISFQRYRNNFTNYTQVASGDLLGVVEYAGWDSLQIVPAANIGAIVDATYSAGTQSPPAALTFATGNLTTAGVPTEKMRIASSGNVGIANTNPLHTISVTGTMNVSGNANVGNIGATRGVFTNIAGEGGNISNIQGANVSGAVATATSATTAGTVTTAAQPNITSTGTLTSLTVSGNITAQANINVSGYNIRSVATGIIALGINQGTATAITKEMNVVSTALLGNGVILPTAVAGMAITIINTSANTLLVYPHSGGDINGGATNAAYSQPAGATLQYVAPTTTDWYTVGATFA